MLFGGATIFSPFGVCWIRLAFNSIQQNAKYGSGFSKGTGTLGTAAALKWLVSATILWTGLADGAYRGVRLGGKGGSGGYGCGSEKSAGNSSCRQPEKLPAVQRHFHIIRSRVTDIPYIVAEASVTQAKARLQIMACGRSGHDSAQQSFGTVEANPDKSSVAWRGKIVVGNPARWFVDQQCFETT